MPNIVGGAIEVMGHKSIALRPHHLYVIVHTSRAARQRRWYLYAHTYDHMTCTHIPHEFIPSQHHACQTLDNELMRTIDENGGSTRTYRKRFLYRFHMSIVCISNEGGFQYVWWVSSYGGLDRVVSLASSRLPSASSLARYHQFSIE